MTITLTLGLGRTLTERAEQQGARVVDYKPGFSSPEHFGRGFDVSAENHLRSHEIPVVASS